MDDRALWLRSGYFLEFTVKNGRKTRREMVSEFFPVKVRVVSELEPALFRNVDGEDPRAVLYVHGGELYEGVRRHEDTTVDEFERLMRDKDQDMGRDRVLWHRNDLARRGIENFSVISAPLRESLNLKEVSVDERGDGLVRAHGVADKLLICGNLVLKKATAIPCRQVLYRGHDLSSMDRWEIEPGFAGSVEVSRCFRIDDKASVTAFNRRMRAQFPIWGNVSGQRVDRNGRAYSYRWTDAGKAVEDTPAWWLIRTAHSVARRPLGSDPLWSVMDADTVLIAELLGLRDDVAAFRDFVPIGEQASIAADRVVTRFTRIRELVGDDARPPYKRLAEGLDFVANEIEADPPRPVSDTHINDDAAFAAF